MLYCGAITQVDGAPDPPPESLCAFHWCLFAKAAKYFTTSGERPQPVTITNITGKVPAWFKGTVIRNVQGLYEQGE